MKYIPKRLVLTLVVNVLHQVAMMMKVVLVAMFAVAVVQLNDQINEKFLPEVHPPYYSTKTDETKMLSKQLKRSLHYGYIN